MVILGSLLSDVSDAVSSRLLTSLVTYKGVRYQSILIWVIVWTQNQLLSWTCQAFLPTSLLLLFSPVGICICVFASVFVYLCVCVFANLIRAWLAGMAGQTVRRGWDDDSEILCIQAVYQKTVCKISALGINSWYIKAWVGSQDLVYSQQRPSKHFLVVVNLPRREYKWSIFHWHHRLITTVNWNSFRIHEPSWMWKVTNT